MTYAKVLKREFGRTTGVSAGDARDRAALLEEQADDAPSRAAADRMQEAAGALRDYAADEEGKTAERYEEAEEEEETTTGDTPARESKSSSSSSSSRRRGKVARATKRELVDRPGDAVANTAGTFWRFVTLTLGIILLGLLLQKSGKAVALINQTAYWTSRLVYPKGAFGPFVDNLHNRSADGTFAPPLIGPPAPENIVP